MFPKGKNTPAFYLFLSWLKPHTCYISHTTALLSSASVSIVALDMSSLSRLNRTLKILLYCDEKKKLF